MQKILNPLSAVDQGFRNTKLIQNLHKKTDSHFDINFFFFSHMLFEIQMPYESKEFKNSFAETYTQYTLYL